MFSFMLKLKVSDLWQYVTRLILTWKLEVVLFKKKKKKKEIWEKIINNVLII